MAKVSKAKLQEIKLDLIDEPKGVIRLEIDQEKVRNLAENINAIGLLQPIIVRTVGERFEIVAGHRRYLAHKLLRRDQIPAIIRKIDDMGTALVRASENIRRVDLSPIEEAAVYADLRDSHGMTVEEIGKEMGKTQGIVKRRLDLLKMPPQLQKAVHLKQISYGVAEELWRIDDIGSVDYYLSFAIDHGVTVGVARGWVKDFRDAKRREDDDTGGGGGVPSGGEPRPVYVSCDLCQGPMVLGSELLYRVCPECGELIRGVLKNK